MLIFFIVSSILAIYLTYKEIKRQREDSEKFKNENKEFCELLDKKYDRELEEINKEGERRWG